jgi:hypothetical protein
MATDTTIRLNKHEWDKLMSRTAPSAPVRSRKPAPVGLEPHYTPEELGAAWHLSANTIRRMFENETGVLLITRPEKMHKRGYKTMRIPKTVADRVRSKCRVKGMEEK